MTLSTRTAITNRMRARDALCHVVVTVSRDFDRHLQGLMMSADPEFPHGARVALRRLRSSLAGFSPLIDKSVLAGLKHEVRMLSRHIGTLRDADMLAQGLATMSPQAQHERLRAEVRQALAACDAGAFAARLRTLFQSDDWKRKGAKARRWQKARVRRVAVRALSRAWSACLEKGKSVKKMPPPDRHAFRKKLKTLRYLGEYFGDLWPGSSKDHTMEQLRQLQETLGVLNDIATIHATSEPDQAAQTLLDARMSTALGTAEADWRKLRKRPPFWA
jgi:CHAD domain-containing protein